MNFARLGKTFAAGVMVAVGIGVAGLLMAAAVLLLDETPAMLFYNAHVMISYFLAAMTQQTAIAAHQRSGGKLASLWWTTGIAIVISLVTAIAFFGLVLVVPESACE